MELAIQEILGQLEKQLGSGSDTALLDAQVLVAHHLGKPRSWVIAHPDALLSSLQQKLITESAGRLAAGEPLPYVLGHWEFFGLDFLVTPDVLIPRPETELLVDRAIRWLKLHPQKRRVVDIGTGSGCIGISIAVHVPMARILLTDISSAALEVARRNAAQHDILEQVEFREADLLGGLPGPFDLVCANLPYIPSQILEQLPVAQSEPRLALDGGVSGTSLTSRLLEEAQGQLMAGGMLFVEIEANQGDELLTQARMLYPQSCVKVLKDLSGKDRCVAIERPSQIVHLCPHQEWLEQKNLPEYRDLSLEQAGFIHCSQPEQINEIANRYYSNQAEIVVLWIDPGKLISEIRWEQAGSSYYPHVYGPINRSAINAMTTLEPGRDDIIR